MTARVGSPSAPLYTRLVHSDWSNGPNGRWTASARFVDGVWTAGAPRLVGPLDAFVAGLFADPAAGPLLVGFDFPIGLPLVYALRTRFTHFAQALTEFGTGDWDRFFVVAETAAEIGLRRPFYPMKPGPKGMVRQKHLLDALGVGAMADLRRRCEAKGTNGKVASPMFWTLGAAAVGKAAVHGWREAIRPAVARGARVWPFDGDLDTLAATAAVTLAETYPGDAYGQIGLSMKGLAKTNQADRHSLAPALRHWAVSRAVRLDAELDAAIEAGFGPKQGQDNGFDAVVALFAMIAVATGEHPDGAPTDDDIRRWEGWILGHIV